MFTVPVGVASEAALYEPLDPSGCMLSSDLKAELEGACGIEAAVDMGEGSTMFRHAGDAAGVARRGVASCSRAALPR